MNIAFWKPEYSVSVKSIDADHQKLFDLLNQLFEAMSKGQSKNVLTEIIGELERYTIYHFHREETYFRITNYPQKDAHIEQHQYYVKKIAEMRKQYEKDSSAVSAELLGFLSNWLKEHILVTDKAYQEHFKKHSVV